MSAAKKIILLLWLVVANLASASALTPGATETRVGQKSFAAHESRQAEPLQTPGLPQRNESCGYELAPESLLAAKGAGSSVDDLVRAAQKEFPNKAGKIEQHHNPPKYLGGDPKGPLTPLDAAYHQKITTEFRRLHPYGSEPPSPQRLQEIMRQVYEKYPLLPGN